MIRSKLMEKGNNAAVNVSDWIDGKKFSGYQVSVIVLCALVALLDGFDTAVISFVAPEIARIWDIDATLFTPVFSMGLFGLMLGALIFGTLADKIGRKNVIIASTFIFGLFSILTVLSNNLTQLILFRFLTGLGLGGALPNIIALTAEYSPKRLRATMVSLTFIGVPAGSLIGGFITAHIISSLGWKSIFYLGGILPMLLGFVLIFALPESIRFHAAKGASSGKAIRIMRRIDPAEKLDEKVRLIISEQKAEGFTVKHLFGGNRARNTLLLWIVFFMNLLVMYFLINWMPTVLKAAGFPIEKAIIASTMMQCGGIIGGILASRIGDRGNPRKILVRFYLLAAVSVAAIGLANNLALLMVIILVAGFSVIGSQFIINGLAASIYPTNIRSTGVGWALGIGRIGSIIGPAVGGIILSLKWGTAGMYLVGAIPAVFAAIAVLLLSINSQKDG
ncbi:MAG: MFS transporter [Acidobacteriota bacterium]|nr:MFS transporter [Acidobacteriota bacterium]